MIEAIEIKRKMYFEYENAPYHCLDVDVSKPTARGGQTLVRVKMRNLLTRAVFDRTFKAGEKFYEPDLARLPASYLYADSSGYNFMDQASFETLTLDADTVGDDRFLLADNVDGADPDLQRPADRHPVPAARRADGDLDRSRRARGHGQRQRHQGRRSSKPAWRSTCRSSSRKARRSRSTPRRGSSPAALDPDSYWSRRVRGDYSTLGSIGSKLSLG